MYAKQLILFISMWLLSSVCYSQYTYSYTDPCTGIVKSVPMSTSGVNLTVYGQTHFFQPNDFLNGSVQNWAQSVVSSFGSNNPCASLVGVPTAINITQSNAISFVSIINTLSAATEMGGSTDFLSGVTSASDADANNDKKKDNTTNTSNGSTTSATTGTTGVTTTSGTNNTTGNTSSGITTSGTNTTTNNTTTSITSGTSATTGSNSTSGGGGSVNVVGTSVNSTQNVSTESNKNGTKPTIIASSDLVGFNFKNTDVSYGGKFSSSYTSTKWDGSSSHGIMGDYTTAIKGPNIAGFYAFLHKKRIDLISTSVTLGFDTKFSIYGTLAVGQMWKFKKIKKLKAVYLATASYGSVYQKQFFGTAFIAGGMYDWKVSKRIDVKLLGLYVYAPYVKYYNDVLLKSPNVVLPIVGTNIGITKRFKINVNMGGAYAININTLNYTIMMGTRLLL